MKIPHAPAVHHAVPTYSAAHPVDDLSEPSPFTYTYGVSDDYSKASFNTQETNDGTGTFTGSYSVALHDGRTQMASFKKYMHRFIMPLQRLVSKIQYKLLKS